MLYVTHDRAEAIEYAKKMLLLERGKIVAGGRRRIACSVHPERSAA